MNRSVKFRSSDLSKSIDVNDIVDLVYRNDKYGSGVVITCPAENTTLQMISDNISEYPNITLYAQNIDFASITYTEKSVVSFSIDTSGDRLLKILDIFVEKEGVNNG